MQVLNACVQSRQWKGVYWVFKQLRKSSLKPNGATYGLAMEVSLMMFVMFIGIVLFIEILMSEGLSNLRVEDNESGI